jgi:hypothetical protein
MALRQAISDASYGNRTAMRSGGRRAIITEPTSTSSRMNNGSGAGRDKTAGEGRRKSWRFDERYCNVERDASEPGKTTARRRCGAGARNTGTGRRGRNEPV